MTRRTREFILPRELINHLNSIGSPLLEANWGVVPEREFRRRVREMLNILQQNPKKPYPSHRPEGAPPEEAPEGPTPTSPATSSAESEMEDPVVTTEAPDLEVPPCGVDHSQAPMTPPKPAAPNVADLHLLPGHQSDVGEREAAEFYEQLRHAWLRRRAGNDHS